MNANIETYVLEGHDESKKYWEPEYYITKQVSFEDFVDKANKKGGKYLLLKVGNEYHVKMVDKRLGISHRIMEEKFKEELGNEKKFENLKGGYLNTKKACSFSFQKLYEKLKKENKKYLVLDDSSGNFGTADHGLTAKLVADYAKREHNIDSQVISVNEFCPELEKDLEEQRKKVEEHFGKGTYECKNEMKYYEHIKDIDSYIVLFDKENSK